MWQETAGIGLQNPAIVRDPVEDDGREGKDQVWRVEAAFRKDVMDNTPPR
jgi:hypothetical protein